MFRKAVLIVTLYLSAVPAGFCLDWKTLNELSLSMTVQDAEGAVQRAPDAANLYLLGLVNLRLHQDTAADVAFARLLSLDPKAAEAKWGRAEVLRRRHRLQESEQILKEVIREEPEFPSSYISLAYIRYLQMDFNAATRLTRQVIMQGDAVDHENLVWAYVLFAGSKGMLAYYGGPLSKIVNGSAVLPNLRAARRLRPESAAVGFGFGSFYLLAPPLFGGSARRAEGALRQALAADPMLADTYVRLAQFYAAVGDDGKYASYLKKALQLDPQNELADDTKSGRCRFLCGPMKSPEHKPGARTLAKKEG